MSKYTDQKISHGWGIETVNKGDSLLFVNQPHSFDPRKPNYETVEHAVGGNLAIGKILTQPEDQGAYWIFKTDLQDAPVYHRRDLLINKVETV